MEEPTRRVATVHPMPPNPDENPAERRAPAAADQESPTEFQSFTTIRCFMSVFVILLIVVALIYISHLRSVDRFFFPPPTTNVEAEMGTLCNETRVYRGKERELPPPFHESTEAEGLLDFKNAEKYSNSAQMEDALAEYLKIHKKLPTSFRANYGAARAYEWNAYRLDKRTESMDSLVNASTHYQNALDHVHKGVTEDVIKKIELRLIDIYEDLGNFQKATKQAGELINKYPNDAYYIDRLARLYIRGRKFPNAIQNYRKLLKKWPDYTLAYIYLGYVAHRQGRWLTAVQHLFKGITVSLPDTEMAIYYEALGDSLQRLGRKKEAVKYYEEAVKKHIFRSIYQRSYNIIDRLTGKPWWNVEDFERKDEKLITFHDFYRKLTSLSRTLGEELRHAVETMHFIRYGRDTEYYRANNVSGSVRKVLVYDRGYKTPACILFPQLTRLFDKFLPTRRCWKCDVKYLMIKKTHIWPKCNKVDNLLTTHLPISVPRDVSIRVHDETRTWTEGEVLIFDGTFEHEIWNNGTGVLMLLSFDAWSPELTESEKQILNTF